MWLKDYHLNKFGYKNLKIRKVSVISKITREISSKRLNARGGLFNYPYIYIYYTSLISFQVIFFDLTFN